MNATSAAFPLSPSNPAILVGAHAPNERAELTLVPQILEDAAVRWETREIAHVLGPEREVRCSYATLLGRAHRILGGLRDHGFQAGDRVLLQLSETALFVEAFWGCLMGGLVPISMQVPESYYDHHAGEFVRRVWQDIRHPPIVTSAAQAEQIDGWAIGGRVLRCETLVQSPPAFERPLLDQRSSALLQFTSGTAGKARCVSLSHANLLSAIKGTAALAFSSATSSFCWTGLEHVASIVWHLREAYLGHVQAWASPNAFAANPLMWLDWLHKHRAEATRAPNSAFWLVVKALEREPHRCWDLSAVKFIVNGGEPINPITCGQFAELLATSGLRRDTIIAGYGLTETAGGVIYSERPCLPPDGVCTVDRDSLSLGARVQYVDSVHPRAVSLAQIGPPCPGVSVRVVAGDGELTTEHTVGRVQLKGARISPATSVGDEDSTPLSDEQWFDTGDVGFIASGVLVLTGRAKDLLIIRGRNVLILDLELCLQQVEGVDSSCVAVLRVPDVEADTESCAVLFAPAADTTSSAPEICARISRVMSMQFGFIPLSVLPLTFDDFPRSGSGKLQRGLLRERFLCGELNLREPKRLPIFGVDDVSQVDVAGAQPAISAEAAVVRLFSLALSQAADLDSDFFSLGGNSLQAAALVASLEAHFNTRLPTDALFRWATPRQLVAAVMLHADARNSRASTGIVTLNSVRHGCPIFMVPGIIPTPWEYQALLRVVKFTQPVYGLRCPDLDWTRDVMSIDEMIAHHVTMIRQVRPHGPYALLGYSWGGVMAFQIANRLLVDGEEVRRLVLLDTTGPAGQISKYFRPHRPWVLVLLAFLARHGLASGRFFDWLDKPVHSRVTLTFGRGPLTVCELRRVFRAVSSSIHGNTDNLSFEELCSAIVSEVRASMSLEQWNHRISVLNHLPADDHVAIVKLWKVLVKNRLLASRHTPTAVFPDTITVYASYGNKDVLKWQRFSRKTLDVVWLPATNEDPSTAHDRFLQLHNVALYESHLRALMDSASC